MFCKNCGKEVDNQAVICASCGVELKNKVVEKTKAIWEKFKEIMERFGLKVSVSLLVYTILIAFTTVQLDRLYIKMTIEREASKAIEVLGEAFGGSDSKTKKNKWKFLTPKPKQITINDMIGDGKEFEATFKKALFTNKVSPPKPDPWFSTYYQVKDKENILIDVVVEVKNLANIEIEPEKLFSSKAIYDSKYEYNSFMVGEAPDGSDFEYTTVIKPLQTRKVRIITEIPKTAKDDDKPVMLLITIDEKEYQLNIKVPASKEIQKDEVKKTVQPEPHKQEPAPKSVNINQKPAASPAKANSALSNKVTVKTPPPATSKEKSALEKSKELF